VNVWLRLIIKEKLRIYLILLSFFTYIILLLVQYQKRLTQITLAVHSSLWSILFIWNL